MNDSERIVKLLCSAVVVETICNSDGEPVTSYETGAVYRYHAKPLADFLIANGVTVQKHGRWEFVDDYTGRCTKCHEESIIDWEYEYKFCPECGAIMDGEANG